MAFERTKYKEEGGINLFSLLMGMGMVWCCNDKNFLVISANYMLFIPTSAPLICSARNLL